MELTTAQKQELCDKGYVKLPGVVPAEMVNRARRAINASLGQNGMDPALLTKFRAQSYCPELQNDPVITDLFSETPIKALAESAIGAGKIKPIGSGQIALRFPSMDPPREPGPHIDGMYSPTNGVPEGTIQNFTALVGVFLSDLPEPYAGNFTVWPGTHTIYERYFREHGPQSLLEGMPKVELPQPEQFLGKAGDAALVHYQLAHGIAGNGSPNVRYAIFFRLKHVDHDQIHWECMTDIWREWEGMRDVVGAPRDSREPAGVR
jgi:hypothetical protein